MFGWKKKPANPETLNLDDWSISQGEIDDSPVLLRLCDGARPMRGHPNYRHCVRIGIAIQNPDDRGFPVKPELDQLADIEDQLDQALTPGFEAVSLLVITSDGIREHVYQTRDVNATLAKIDAVRRSVTTHEFEAVAAEDAAWEYFQQFADA